MHGVRGEQHAAAAGFDRQHELPRGVAADAEGVDARSDLELVVDRAHATVRGGAGEAGHRVGVGVVGEVGALGDRIGPEVELSLGDDELRVREQAEVADVVVVQMRHHDLLHVGAVDPEPGERRGGLERARPALARADLGREPRVDHDRRSHGGSRIQK